MMPSIPASQLVSVLPSVLGTGGNPLSLNAVFLTADPSIPIGTVQAFPDAESVQDWFGPSAQETLDAVVYFSGFLGAEKLPGTLYFFQYNAAAVAGYLRGADTSGITLTQLQGLSGTLTIGIDGRSLISAAINLSSATSFSNAAALIQTAMQSGTTFVGSASQTAAQSHMVVDVLTSGNLKTGDVISGVGVDSGLTIVSQVSGTPGGIGTYQVSTNTGFTEVQITGLSPSVASATCSYDDQRDAFLIESGTTGSTSAVGFPTTNSLATGLLLTAAKGAVVSAGAAGTTPSAAMNAIVAAQQNWATFMTVFDPDSGALPPVNKLAFAEWVSTASPAGEERFAYIAWDADQGPTTSNSDSSCFGALVTAAGYNGVVPVYDQSAGLKAAFICGTAASIDFTQQNGRITFAYKGQAGLVPDVTSASAAANLIANGYNFYGAYATATQQFQFLQPGSMPGEWRWVDPYIDQIWLNNAIQSAVMNLLANVKALPYNTAGYALLRSAILDPINAALFAGVIVAGVALSAAQIQEINTAAGANIATVIQNVGWYLQILPASATTRGNRTSPPMTLWYTDGGSIQQINLDSIDVE